MDKQSYQLLEDINRKLGVMIALLSQPPQTEMSLRDRIVMLERTGLRVSEIASILNKTPGHVSKELTLERKKS